MFIYTVPGVDGVHYLECCLLNNCVDVYTCDVFCGSTNRKCSVVFCALFVGLQACVYKSPLVAGCETGQD